MELLGIDFSDPGSYNCYTVYAIGVYTAVIVISYKFQKNERLLISLPGFCTSVGVFFTFVVLYSKLKDFKVDPNDVTVLQSLVRDLSSAFSTSIIGIFASLVSNFFVKGYTGYIEDKGYKIKPYLKQHPHELLHEIKTTNQKSLNDLKNAISTEFGQLRGEGSSGNLANVYNSLSQLTGTTINRLDELFKQLHTKLDTTISALGKNALESTSETITSANAAFTERTAALLQQNLTELNTFFATHREALQKTAEQFSNQHTGLQTELTNVQQDIKKAIGNIQVGFANSTKVMTDQYNSEAQALKETFGTLRSTLEQLNQDVQGQVRGILESNLATLEASFSRIAELQSTAQNNLQETTKQFAGAVGEYQALSGNQEAILTQLGEQLSDFAELRTHMQNMQGSWQEFSENIHLMENRVADIANTVAQLQQIHEYLNSNGTNANA